MVAGSDFKEIEEKYKAFWEKERIYEFNPKSKKVYSVDTPPPTMSGKMHIGHALSYSQQDFVVRFKRMLGDGSVLYPFGTDDNGLPTEKLVETLNKVKSKDMSRKDFINLCLKTLEEERGNFIQDWKDLGISCDFKVFYSTIDKKTQKISQKSFLDLYKSGDIYRKEFPTIWDTVFQTPVAQAELEDKEKTTFFSTIKFKADGKDLLIATTRPELLGACVAVFVNPKDKRYKNLIGKKAKVPIFGDEVPIIADDSAEMEKGTGVLMICSYGDKFDVDAIQRHKLNPRVVITKDGKLNVKGYEGLKIKEARAKILEDLKELGLIKEQKEIKHIVNVYERSGNEIEFIPTEQFFIKILDKKKKLLSQAKKINWYPKYMYKRYENWVNGLDWDWSISRERHFGIPIPIWYCTSCDKIILAEEKELPVDPLEMKKICPKCKKEATPEKKVLDTWATSSLTPQIVASLVGNKIKIPFSLRPQAHDIIRTWAFYTIVKAYLHEKEIPWKDIVISGNVSLKGEKMSKSKGNVIDPRAVMDKFGADTLRFWAAGPKLGGDLDYQENDLIAGKKIITKMKNAAKFVFMNLEDWDGKPPKRLEVVDGVFLSRLAELVNNASQNFEMYEYSRVKQEVENFFWQDFCDNYLEIVKKRVYQGRGNGKKSAQYTLYKSLLSLVKIFAPIMPFITEDIYQEYFRKFEKSSSIHISSWPKVKNSDLNEIKWFQWKALTSLISKIRQEKTKAQKPMNSEIVLTLSKDDFVLSEKFEDALKDVTNASEIKEGKFKVEFK